MQYRTTSAGYSWCFKKWDTSNAFGSIAKDSLRRTIQKKGFTFGDETLLVDRVLRAYVILASADGRKALLKEGCGCKQGDVSAPQLCDETHTAQLDNWRLAGDQYCSVLHVPSLTLEDQHSDILTSQAVTVLADDAARAGALLSSIDLTRQTEFWNKGLDAALSNLNLFQNKSKQTLVLSSVSEDVSNALARIEFSDKNKLRPEVRYLGSIINYRGDVNSEVMDAVFRAKRAWSSMQKFWTQHAIKGVSSTGCLLSSCAITSTVRNGSSGAHYSSVRYP